MVNQIGETALDLTSDNIRDPLEKMISTKKSKDAINTEIKNHSDDFSDKTNKIDDLTNSNEISNKYKGILATVMENTLNQDPNSKDRPFHKFMLPRNSEKDTKLKKRKRDLVRPKAKAKKRRRGQGQ